MTNLVVLRGDTSSLTIKSTNITGPTPLEFIIGSFRSTPEERRVSTTLHNIGGNKRFQLRVEFTSAQFVEHSITGASLFKEISPSGLKVER